MDVVTLQAAKAFSRKTFEQTGWRVVSMRGRVGNNQSNGTDTTQKSRTRWVIQVPCVELKLVYANFFLNSGAHETANPYTVSITAGYENPTTDAGDSTGGLVIPIFFGAKRVGTMEGNTVLESDPFVVNFAVAQRALWVRNSPSVTSGDKWVNSLDTANTAGANFDGGGVSEGYVAGNSIIDSGTITAASAHAFAPCMILGRPR